MKKITTQSGAVYLYDPENETLARSIGNDGNTLDGIFDEPLQVLGDFVAEAGESLHVRVLVEPDAYWLRSTPVVSIEDV